ncbi:MAG: MBL fold metallo-hydrolase [Candidatus Woesearchaeota archaeon]
MKPKVKVLVKGHIKLSDDSHGRGWSTTVLIDDGENKIIVDPGTVESHDIIHKALEQENLSVNDITHVIITHSHLDHYRNLGMFPEAIAVDIWGYWIKDRAELVEWPETYSRFEPSFSQDIHIVRTPGHDDSSLTVFVDGETTLDGKQTSGIIAICGDVFWKKDFPSLEDEPFATDTTVLKQSRKLVLDNSDYIIPGHDDMFVANP